MPALPPGEPALIRSPPLVARFFWICFGGAVGTGLRYSLSVWMPERFGTGFPWATLTVNVVGCFLLGAIMHLALRNVLSADLRLIFGTGVMGGLTTYSTFNYEAIKYMQDRAFAMAGLYAGTTAAACLLAGFAGIAVARMWAGS